MTKGISDKQNEDDAVHSPPGRLLLCGLYIILISYFSLLPSRSLNPLIERFGFPYADLVVHVLMYAGLAAIFLWGFSFKTTSRGLLAAVLVFGFSYGIFMEILQQLIWSLDRLFSWKDIAANGFGALLGLVGYLRLSHAVPVGNDHLTPRAGE